MENEEFDLPNAEEAMAMSYRNARNYAVSLIRTAIDAGKLSTNIDLSDTSADLRKSLREYLSLKGYYVECTTSAISPRTVIHVSWSSK